MIRSLLGLLGLFGFVRGPGDTYYIEPEALIPQEDKHANHGYRNPAECLEPSSLLRQTSVL